MKISKSIGGQNRMYFKIEHSAGPFEIEIAIFELAQEKYGKIFGWGYMSVEGEEKYDERIAGFIKKSKPREVLQYLRQNICVLSLYGDRVTFDDVSNEMEKHDDLIKSTAKKLFPKLY